MNFLKLLNFEFNRFFKLYLIIIIVTIVSQLGGAFFTIRRYLSSINDAIFNGGMTPENYVLQNGKISLFDFLYNYSFLIPIVIGITSLLFYMFFIWYRDWFTKNTFIYRLLTLPINRINLFWSKLCLIMLTVLGLVSLQIILLKIQAIMLKTMVPIVYREDLLIGDIIANFHYLNILIPSTGLQFIIAYGLGLLFVTIVFTAILFERSFRIKGIVLGVIYAFVTFILFLSPFIFAIYTGVSYLYQDEYVLIGTILWLIIFVMSLLISRHLLNKKVTV